MAFKVDITLYFNEKCIVVTDVVMIICSCQRVMPAFCIWKQPAHPCIGISAMRGPYTRGHFIRNLSNKPSTSLINFI